MNNNSISIVGSAVLLIGSNVVYHVSQKSLPAAVNPIVSIIATFFIALVISILILPIFADMNAIKVSLGYLSWANCLSGISCVGIVLGHVFYYRSGWSLSSGTLFSYGAICIILIPVGLLFFHEKITLSNMAGIIISLVGLHFLIKK
jgi:drug/metabolite transporter (DMT)-like permease